MNQSCKLATIVFAGLAVAACFPYTTTRPMHDRPQGQVALTPMQDRPLSQVIELAESGELEAIHNLCYRYKYGQSAPLDYSKARSWCFSSALQGASSSQVLLAEMFYLGEGVDQDYDAALVWYEAAASQDHPHALLMLYQIYARGFGVVRDPEQALVFLRSAAAVGYQPAINELERLEKLLEH